MATQTVVVWPHSDGPSVRVPTTELTRAASGIVAQGRNSHACIDPNAHGSGAVT